MRTALNAVVSGGVQGIMFRDFVQRKATLLGLTGEVRNTKDGTVAVHAEGERETLEKLLPFLRKGPLFARVKNVSVTWVEPTHRFDSFTIEY